MSAAEGSGRDSEREKLAATVGDDYIDRTIATVRNHRDADSCWPQWANIFADEIERLRAVLAQPCQGCARKNMSSIARDLVAAESELAALRETVRETELKQARARPRRCGCP